MRTCPTVLIWLLAGLTAAVGQANKPSISFDAVSRDAGKVTQGETIRQVFTFTNKGNGTLVIKGMEPS